MTLAQNDAPATTARPGDFAGLFESSSHGGPDLLLERLAGYRFVSGDTPETLTIPEGGNLRLVISRGSRLTGKGEMVTATLTQPVYVGNDLAISPGALISGRVASIMTQDKRVRMGRLIEGDFTPPRVARVIFDKLILADGTTLPFFSEATIGQPEVKRSVYRTKAERPGLKAQVSGQVHEVLHSPNKVQRLTEAAIVGLPYHPEYIDQGTVYDAALVRPFTVPALQQESARPGLEQAGMFLHLRLLTAVDSGTSVSGQEVRAELSEPFIDAATHVALPAGVRLTGRVSKTAAAGWMKKQGSMTFAFTSFEMEDSTTRPLSAPVHAVEAADAQGLEVGSEGGLRATSSRLQQIMAPLSLIGPSKAIADRSTVKTAWSRSGEGRKGFGLVGSGAAQASAGAAIGLGYYGAAQRIYSAFIAKGADVSLPVNTPIVLRMQN